MICLQRGRSPHPPCHMATLFIFLFAQKKSGALRLCVDYVYLNANTVVDHYPLPHIDELLNCLSGCSVF